MQAVIVATAILHNLCINMNDVIPPDDDDVLRFDEDVHLIRRLEGEQVNNNKRLTVLQHFENLHHRR